MTIFYLFSISFSSPPQDHQRYCKLVLGGVKGKGKVVPLQARRDPEGSRKLRFTDFVTAQDSVRLSALRTGRLYPHFCYRLSRPQGHSAIGRILFVKITISGLPNRLNSCLILCSAYYLTDTAAGGGLDTPVLYPTKSSQCLRGIFEKDMHKSIHIVSVQNIRSV